MKLAKIKWENIFLIMYIPFCIYCLILHNTNGEFLWDMFLFEILIHSLLGGAFYTGAYGLRKEFVKEN